MGLSIGDVVQHPVSLQKGKIVNIHQNPACLMRSLVVEWEDGSLEEVEEIEFGPLED